MSDEHVRRSYVVENNWKCPNCQAANPGRFTKCQKCGQTKQKADVDQIDENAAEVQDQNLLQMANAGENWVCQFCGAQERASDGTCKNCGAKVKDAGSKLPPRPGQGQQQQQPPPPQPASGGHTIRNVGIGFGGLLLLTVGYCMMPHHKATTISAVNWEYTVELEQKTLTHKEGFGPPAGAMNMSCQQRQDGTHNCDPYTCTKTVKEDCNAHDCNCHKKTVDKGNGFSQVEEVCSTCYDKCDKTENDTCYHQCPTMRDWCRYDVYEWPVVNTQKATGHDQNVHWPELQANNADQRIQKHEKYEVTFASGNDKWNYEPANLDDFKKYTVGASWKIKVNGMGSVTPETPEK
jgi:hypothetical protein